MKKTIHLALATLLCLISCSKNDEILDSTAEKQAKDLTELNTLLKNTKSINQISPKPETAISDKKKVGTIGDETVYTQDYDAALPFESLNLFESSSDIFFPGALFEGESITSKDYKPILVDRAPITISTSLTGSGSKVSMVIDDPKLSTVRQKMNELITQDFDVPPGRMNYELIDINDENHLKTALGIQVGFPMISVGGSFDFSKSKKRSHTIVTLTQEYYTLDLDLPARPSDFFKPTALEYFLESQTTPVYVSSVKMGRRLYLCIDSEMSSIDVKAAINASYSNIYNVSGTASVEFNKMCSKSNVKAYVLGGDADGAAVNIGDFSKFRELMVSGAKFGKNNIGVPISYNLRSLNNNTKLATVIYNKYTKTTYEKTIPDQYAATFKIEKINLNNIYNYYYNSLRSKLYFKERDFAGNLETTNESPEIWSGDQFQVVSKSFKEGLEGDKQYFTPRIWHSKKYLPEITQKIDMKDILEKYLSNRNKNVYTKENPLKIYLEDDKGVKDPDNYMLVSVTINDYK